MFSFKDVFLVLLEQDGKNSYVPQDISSASYEYLKLLFTNKVKIHHSTVRRKKEQIQMLSENICI